MRFTLHIIATIEMSEDEIWPDGDGPDRPTREDVEKRVKEQGGISRIMDDWNLARALELSVSGPKG